MSDRERLTCWGARSGSDEHELTAMQIRPSSLVRAAGAAVAAAVSGPAPRGARVLILAGSDLAARRLDPVGLQPFAISPSANLDVLVSGDADVVTAVAGALSWTALNLLVDAGGRMAHIPAPVRAALMGASVYVADVAVSRAHETAQAAPAAP